MSASKRKSDIIDKAVQQDMDTRDFGTFKKSETVAVGTRLDVQDRAWLERHFEEQGLKLGQGLRMIIKQYINANS